MAIKFKCPTCNAIHTATDRLMGREISCPECGNKVSVPSAEQIEAARQQREMQRRQREEQLLEERRLSEALQRQVPVAAQVVEAVEVVDVEEEQAKLEAEERALAAASANFTRPKPPSGEDMDMTPMVDVTFLLLIFFMITASFSVQKSIQRPAAKPDEASTNAQQQEPEENKDTVEVQVDEFNAYNIVTSDWDRPAGSKQDLIVTLNEAHAGDSSGNQPTKLVIRAHEDCIHAAVIAALDAGREAQFESFEVSTVEQFD